MHHFHIENDQRVTIEKPRDLDSGRASVSVFANKVQVVLYFKEIQNASQFFCDMITKGGVDIAQDKDRNSAVVTLNFHRITHCEVERKGTALGRFSSYEKDGAYQDFSFHYIG